ncbi:TPA: DUF1642 domain-containing protein [Enterococcus faecium]|nr:DUF1642 domain-containing protein [Enterococcus faecium]HAR1432994.1 DUF1642 domain-containing protein [Enterococcus faecium]HAR1460007.1 DUF1642 domain-containing protein [Enterococcus faecium]HBK5582421.1 DUF1642 domain-containing protein [Enterococcus faecium]
MDELITKVEQWAKDKGLDQADPKAQFLKVAEEFGEIASAMARSNDELFKDSVGDVIVTLIILSMQKGTNVQECLEMAYNEIKGRTGKMVDGVFVKSSDLEDSYEVEKEPLYEVIIGDLYLIKKFNNRNDFCFDTSCSLCTWEKSAYQLTEAEIKAIDERFWPFAVPVEEVAER